MDYKRKQCRSRDQERRPEACGTGSCFGQSWTIEQHMLKGPNFTLAEAAETSFIVIGPVANKSVSPVSAGKHSGRNDCLGDFKRTSCISPDWMFAGEGHTGGVEVSEGWEDCSLSPKLDFPPVYNPGLGEALPLVLSRGRLQSQKRIW